MLSRQLGHRRIALISCAKKKLSVRAMAKELYISTLFQKSRQWAEQNCDQWFVLSAKHGLVKPTQIINPYEKRLARPTLKENSDWANKAFKGLASLGLLREGVTFVWLAGKDYRSRLSELLKDYPQENPLGRRKHGSRLKWLKKALSRKPLATTPVQRRSISA